jgi:hypothetical protein
MNDPMENFYNGTLTTSYTPRAKRWEATQSQINYLRQLGVKNTPKTKYEAAKLIQETLRARHQSPTIFEWSRL